MGTGETETAFESSASNFVHTFLPNSSEMDVSNDTEPYSVCDLFKNTFISIRLFLHLFSVLVTFPLYIYVHRANRARDKNKSHYAVTNHFYIIVCALQFSVYFVVFLYIFFHFLPAGDMLYIFLYVYIVCSFFTIVIVTSVQNFLLFAIALRRFLIFFLPLNRRFLAFDQKAFKRTLITLYLFYFSLPFIYLKTRIECGRIVEIAYNQTFNRSDVQMAEDLKDCVDPHWSLFTRIYITGDILVMFSAVLYAIMLIRVRNWSKIAGDPLNHPERYIFYQTVLIVITKLLAVLILIIEGKLTEEDAFYDFFVNDNLTTPFVIQMSYLCCNRTNIDTILSIQFKKLRTWQVLCCGEKPERQSRKRRNAAVKYARNKVVDQTVKPSS